ncbi:hypothetical protein QWJ26_10535 [Streptomyces sp. CSDS2]|uniref:hypothetical protein n=1 Tax=Streptomyces sp. CSDS2 TaxID=3055051 RepID=UPI0025AFE38E|nr:hypothetical protein [Streptomyces sp. CSDS2]MDN3260238.1 hypothetical protein [Streptomyces sp. CSDS2]
MIGVWGGGDGSAGRSRRAALLIGLVLVIAAHLTGSVHACSFAGSGPSAVAAGEVAQPADTADGANPTGPPRHRHTADGHLDHTADRPRAALDDTGLDGGQHPPALSAVPRGRPTHPGWRRPSGVPRDRANGPSLATVCVLRQ